MFLPIFNFFNKKNPEINLMKSLDGIWGGKYISSTGDFVSDLDFLRIKASFKFDSQRIFSTFKIYSDDFSFEKDYFIKRNPENNNSFLLFDRYNEEIGNFFYQRLLGGESVLFRGLVFPKNDQLTANLNQGNLVISITDQFSSNFTTILLHKESSSEKLPLFLRTGIFIVTALVIIFSLYKAGDLAEVIKPDEGKYAEMMKIKSKRDAKIKEYQEKSAALLNHKKNE